MPNFEVIDCVGPAAGRRTYTHTYTHTHTHTHIHTHFHLYIGDNYILMQKMKESLLLAVVSLQKKYWPL
jgi:hypothetical protein